MNKFSIGDIVKQRRKQLGMTQDQLAELSELSINFLSKFENRGKQNISVTTLLKLADALRLEPIDLLKGVPTVIGTKQSSQEQLLLKKLHAIEDTKRDRLIDAFMKLIDIMDED
ncbi:hypothetical protein YK48G_18790 [Lentilactobacillus fungorum]|uniref:HTH cro/C1-type domain-containing protein n=1 Tax=Lentilactobacillus fungorum TaxID=2201250 RepID=A0ABQ3W4P0_9LACO|nr:helix-turn-helix transcriptional regulator [Lentilactobacillus fungorum]GHP14454.1 hypothetical protein YK48G_18790 [Lentilactobacillus fungorum]